MNYDIIGDIHGHAHRLETLLKKLDYSRRTGAWRHPDRSAIFVGDFIDRGPGQLATLKTVRRMIEAGSARAVIGNHEFNAIAYATPDPLKKGSYLRLRDGEKGKKNRQQHEAFLREIEADSPEHGSWIQWFYELPLWIEDPHVQVVHACWSPKHMDMLRPHLLSNNRLTPGVVEAASRKGKPLHGAMETILKGAEVRLPDGYSFKDRDGHDRHEIRTKWWNPDLTTYCDAYIGPSGVSIPDIQIPNHQRIPEPDRATFIGHYWFDGAIEPASKRVVCVDFSVAKNGPLVAYRFDGERELSKSKFVAV